MKVRIKNLIMFVGIFTILFFSLSANLIYSRTKPRNDFFVYLNTNSDGEENTSELDFIKSNEGIMSFLGDGWILLYGGISLIAISVAGIVFVLIPKKGKNNISDRKPHKQDDYNNKE